MEKFDGRGLSIIGVTGETDEEGREKTVDWVEDKGMQYGYAYDEGLALFRSLGLNAFPSAVLIDPFGNIVYSGHPARLDSLTIESALIDALPMPLHAWGEELAPVKSALAMGHYGPAKTAAAKLTGVEAAALMPAFIDRIVGVRVAGATALVEKLDVRGAMKALDGYEDAYAGLEGPLASMAALAEQLKGERAQAALVAQERVTAILGELQSEEAEASVELIEGHLVELQKIAKDFDGLAPGDDASGIVEMLPDYIEYLKQQK